MKKIFNLSEEEKKQILEMHQDAAKTFINEQQATPAQKDIVKTITNFDLISDMKKNYGKATIFYGEKKDEAGNLVPQYSFAVNNKIISTFGTKGQVAGPTTASEYMRTLNIPETEFNSVAKLIQNNFNQFKVPTNFPLAKYAYGGNQKA